MVKRLPFERPTDYYDERIASIDEQICALIKQRKDISNNNSGYPPLGQIASWAVKFCLYEDFLKSLFGVLGNEETYRPRVEPAVFRKHLPVLKAVERDGEQYTVTFIRQYNNASVINLQIDLIPSELEHHQTHRHRFFGLYLGEEYDCRNSGGGGSDDHRTYRFIVTPPVPDDVSDLHFIFQEYTSMNSYGELTGFKVSIDLNELTMTNS